jgi:hypothetical protein
MDSSDVMKVNYGVLPTELDNDTGKKIKINSEKFKFNSDPFWAKNYKIIYDTQRLTEFFPSGEMTMAEKLNAIARLSIYIGIILSLLTYKYLYLYIPISVLLITYIIYTMQKNDLEFYLTNTDELKNTTNTNIATNVGNTLPTQSNPFMNFNVITDDPKKTPAVSSYDNKIIKKDIENKFNHNLYRDVSDLYGNNNSQRQYYTMPSTTFPNDQTSYAKWLYNTGPTCKENGIKCVPYWNPNISNQEFNIQGSTF